MSCNEKDECSAVRRWLENHEDFSDCFALEWVLSNPKLIRAVFEYMEAHQDFVTECNSQQELLDDDEEEDESRADDERVLLLQTGTVSVDKLNCLDYDDLSLSTNETLLAILHFFKECGVFEHFNMNEETLFNWLFEVKENCSEEHPYHNWRHAFSVTQTLFSLMSSDSLAQRFAPSEKLAMLVAALCHELSSEDIKEDVNPPMTLYFPSWQERAKLDCFLSTLWQQECNIFEEIASDDLPLIMETTCAALAGFSSSQYLERVQDFHELIESEEFSWLYKEHRDLFRSMTLTACGLAVLAKPWDVHESMSKSLLEGMLSSGDKDCTAEMMMDMIETALTLFNDLASLDEAFEDLCAGASSNYLKWMAISENGAQQNHCDDEEMVSLKLKESQLAAQDLETSGAMVEYSPTLFGQFNTEVQTKVVKPTASEVWKFIKRNFDHYHRSLKYAFPHYNMWEHILEPAAESVLIPLSLSCLAVFMNMKVMDLQVGCHEFDQVLVKPWHMCDNMSKSVIEGMFSLYQKEITTEMLMDMIKNVHTLSIDFAPLLEIYKDLSIVANTSNERMASGENVVLAYRHDNRRLSSLKVMDSLLVVQNIDTETSLSVMECNSSTLFGKFTMETDVLMPMSNSEWKLYTVTYDHKQRSLSFTDLPYNNWRNIIMPEVAINPVLAALSSRPLTILLTTCEAKAANVSNFIQKVHAGKYKAITGSSGSSVLALEYDPLHDQHDSKKESLSQSVTSSTKDDVLDTSNIEVVEIADEEKDDCDGSTQESGRPSTQDDHEEPCAETEWVMNELDRLLSGRFHLYGNNSRYGVATHPVRNGGGSNELVEQESTEAEEVLQPASVTVDTEHTVNTDHRPDSDATGLKKKRKGKWKRFKKAVQKMLGVKKHKCYRYGQL